MSDACALYWWFSSSKKLSRAALSALQDFENHLVVPAIALFEIHHQHSRGRYALSGAQVWDALGTRYNTSFQSDGPELLPYYPAGLEMNDSIYVATARLLAVRHPEIEVAIVTSDSEITAAYARVVW